ncbi:leucyl/phenylalanyl-tRNA--protein transferase [Candidatus Berkiella aquae]|uniref:Leucyl/phenylalanyl-tRNA--protein transferase n=1 Tax=Candidatus Berkiella aquae TaxID=295108 RepID=A0A0Q9YQ30_9GAMM|nr:leucyl/phenylalanyl-tRNA--protein transferase [Candidatus Berkiella aquae]
MALKEPNGLLALGGDLSTSRLLNAYRLGIFPWYDEEPILWWSPDPRTVLFLKDLHISHSLQKFLNKNPFTIKTDENFAGVLQHCAAPRVREAKLTGTWLNPPMQSAYLALHEMGYAHSIEVYENNILVGGLYGISMGRLFFGESMFSLKTNASKVALVALTKQLKMWDFLLIDCQVASSHLFSLGAKQIPRQQFMEILAENNKFDSKILKWSFS